MTLTVCAGHGAALYTGSAFRSRCMRWRALRQKQHVIRGACALRAVHAVRGQADPPAMLRVQSAQLVKGFLTRRRAVCVDLAKPSCEGLFLLKVCTGSMHEWRLSVHVCARTCLGWRRPGCRVPDTVLAKPEKPCACMNAMHVDGSRAECLVRFVRYVGHAGEAAEAGARGRTPRDAVRWRSDNFGGSVQCSRSARLQCERSGATGARIEIRRAPLAAPKVQQILGQGGCAYWTRLGCSAL